MGRGAKLLRASATRELEAGVVWWRIRRVNAMQIMLSAGKALLPGAADAIDARKAGAHEVRGDEDAWRAKLQARAVERVLKHPEMLTELAEAAAASVCAGVTHVLTPYDDDDMTPDDAGRYQGEWEPVRIVMTQEEEEDDDEAVWVYDLTEEQRTALATAVQELSSARAVRGFPGGAA